MAERFIRYYELPPNLYSEGAPVMILAGALLGDTITGQTIIQLKLCNIIPRTIKAIRVCLLPMDTAARPLPQAIRYQYLDLQLMRHGVCGTQAAIMCPDPTTRSFAATVEEVVFADNTVWNAVESTPWQPLSPWQPLNTILPEAALAEQFCIDYSQQAKYVPREERGLRICSCGTINLKDERFCTVCGAQLATQMAWDMAVLKARCDERLAAEERARMLDELQSIKTYMSESRSKEEWQTAKNRLEALGDFEDAAECLAVCDDRIAEEIAKAEAAWKKTKRNLLMVVCGAVLVAMAVVFVTVFWPMIRYQGAVKALENGEYDKAIAVFTEMDDYKDAPDQLLEATYRKAISLQEQGDFEQAATLFEGLGGYSDSKVCAKDCRFALGMQLFEKGDFEEAAKVFKAITSTEATLKYRECQYQLGLQHFEKGDYNAAAILFKAAKTDEGDAKYQECGYLIAVAAMESGDYDTAIEWFADDLVENYKDSKERRNACYTKKAEACYEQGKWSETIRWLDKIGGYDVSSEMYRESQYQLALAQFNGGYYQNAVTQFTKLADYKDSAQKVLEAKYAYVCENNTRSDSTTYTYLKDLKAVGYQDAATRYQELYAWSATLKFTDHEDGYLNCTAISKYSPLYCYATIEGGPPAGETALSYTIVFPNGQSQSSTFSEPVQAGGEPYVYFTDGIYENPFYGEEGTLTITFYDGEGHVVASGSVEIY